MIAPQWRVSEWTLEHSAHGTFTVRCYNVPRLIEVQRTYRSDDLRVTTEEVTRNAKTVEEAKAAVEARIVELDNVVRARAGATL